MMHGPTLALAAAALAAGASLAACTANQQASAPPPGPGPASVAANGDTEGKSCFFLSQVNGFQRGPDLGGGRDSIVVSVGLDRYLFETFGPCPDLDFSETIGFDQNGPGTICRGLDVDLIVPSTIGPHRCPIRMIRKLGEAEAAQY